eukprot:gene12231-15369_t
MVFDERALGALRQKLEALSYNDPLDLSSGPLVNKLVADIVHLQDSLLKLKHQGGKHANDIMQQDGKMDIVQQDASKLQGENSKLHMLLISGAEKFDHAEKEHYQHVKRLEDRISELSFWKQSASEKMATLERENAQLKKKVGELTQMSEQVASGAADPFIATAKMSMSSPLRGGNMSLPTPRSPSRSSVDMLQAANSRIVSLQRQLGDKTSEIMSMAQQMADLKHYQVGDKTNEITSMAQQMVDLKHYQVVDKTSEIMGMAQPMADLKDSVARRDAEISRLGTRAGTDHAADSVARRDAEISRLGTRAGTDHAVVGIMARNEANEDMILQLNQTVDMLRDTVRDQEAAIRNKHQVEVAAQAAERAQRNTEQKLKEVEMAAQAAERAQRSTKQKLKEALTENEAIEREALTEDKAIEREALTENEAIEREALTENEAIEREALTENEAIEREVIRLRNDMGALRSSTNMAANKLANAEVDSALNSVAGLRQAAANRGAAGTAASPDFGAGSDSGVRTQSSPSYQLQPWSFKLPHALPNTAKRQLPTGGSRDCSCS